MKKMVLIPYQQYSAFTDDQTPSISQLNYSSSNPNNLVKSSSRLSKDLILNVFGKNHYKQANSLLLFIENTPNLDWNESGEIIVDGESVAGSHITDLLRDALFNYKNFEPIGVELFYKHLSSVPVSLIRNPRRRLLTGGGGGVYYPKHLSHKSELKPPPPGVPQKNTEVDVFSNLTEWKTEWKTY